MPKSYRTGNPHADQIIKLLDKNTSSGYRPDDVFSDWLQIVEATLEAIPRHVAHLTSIPSPIGDLPMGEGQGGGQDTPETQQLFAHMRARYKHRQHFERFSEAFAVLLNSVDYTAPHDILGEIYMMYGYPNSWAGQFFTPMSLARMMAMMTIDKDGLEKEIHQRVKAAIAKSPIAEALLIASLVLQDPNEAFTFYTTKLIPACYEYIEPITICDPCCGSGVMFLAAASVIPRWALDLNLVHFYGMDIDQGCVRMARLNCLLYGLNGWGIKWALALTELERLALTEPYRSAYLAAQQAHHAGNNKKLAQISRELRGKQMAFFNG